MSTRRKELLGDLGIAVAVFGMLLAISLLAGCGAGTKDLRVAATTVCAASAAGYRAVDKIDAQRQDEVRFIAKADPEAAQRAFAQWKATRGTVRTVLDEAFAQCELAAAAADAIDKGLALPAGAVGRKVAAWIVELLALAPGVARALAAVGIKLELEGAK